MTVEGVGKAAGIILAIALVLTLLYFGPFIPIFVLNTLFGFTLLYTWKTWLAGLLFNMTLSGLGRVVVKSVKS